LSLIAQVALWSAAILDFFLRRYHRRRAEIDPAAVTTIRAFRFAAVFGVWCIAVLVALDNLGVDVTALITGLGIGGVAIALALQNILGDLFASLSIVLDKPFVVGDFIRAGDDLGTVEQIGLKTTRVRSLSGELLVFSNSDLLQSRIRNYKRMEERRILFRIGVVYQTTPSQLRRIPAMVREIIERQTAARFDRAHFAAFGDSSYDFEFVYYVASPDYNVYMDTQQAINLAIVDAFAADKIEFAYPTRTLYLERAQSQK
jgi:small-conductance mechanosensitive channel